MENTLMPDQYVLVDKVAPHFDGYHRGDIVVFNRAVTAPSKP
jgi:signal peptidase I